MLSNILYAETAIRQLTDDVLKQQIESEHFNLHIQNPLAQTRAFAQAPRHLARSRSTARSSRPRAAWRYCSSCLPPTTSSDRDIQDERMQLLERRTQLLGELSLVVHDLPQAAQASESSSSLGKLDALEAIAKELEYIRTW